MMNLLFVLTIWFGQTVAPPAFEVASIKEARPSVENMQAGQFHVGININGSRADYGFMSLADLIPYAYRVRPYQLSGPGWMNETRWDILAKIPEGQPANRTPEMMRTVFAERFKLSVHRETREQSVYALVVGKAGLKIEQAALEEEPSGGFSFRINNDGSGATISSSATGTMRMTPSPNGGMQLHIARITMAGVADRLAQFMDRPVVDATGLQGNYQVTLDLPTQAWRVMAFAQKMAALAGLGSFGAPDANAPDIPGTPIFESAKKLGLELQSRKAPIETIIVDHLEKTPTAN